MGVNVTGIVHYGYGDFYPRTTDEDVEAELSDLEHMGASIVRVIVAYNGISPSETAMRLSRFLTRAEAHHLSVLVSFINYYGPGQNPRGVDRYYTEEWKGILYLNHAFMAEGYKSEYLDLVRTVISATKSHPNIYAWEPGNELQDRDKSTFVAFMQDVSGLMKALDPARPVASGMIEASQAGFTADDLYAQLPNVDMIAIHPGNGYRGSSRDVDWALSHGRKAIVEETGYGARDDRTEHYRDEIEFWWQRGVSAFLIDGFVGKGLADNGNGDSQLGFDTIWHTDYDGLSSLVATYSSPWKRAFAPGPSATPTPGPLRTVDWTEIDARLKAAGYSEEYDHGLLEAGAFARACQCSAVPAAGGLDTNAL